jgi:hypothetical protein
MQMALFGKPKEPKQPATVLIVQTTCPFDCLPEAPIRVLRDEVVWGKGYIHCVCESCQKRFTRQIDPRKNIDAYLDKHFKPII